MSVNLSDMSLEELDQIVDGAPEGAEYFYSQASVFYIKVVTHPVRFFRWESKGGDWIYWPHGSKYLIKLSDIRSHIAELKKNHDWVGARVVYIDSNLSNDIWQIQREMPSNSDSDSDFEIAASIYGFPAPSKCWRFYAKTNSIRLATDEEIATGYRIEQPMVDLELKAPEPKLHWFLVGYSFKSKYGSDGTGNVKVGRINKDLRESDLVDIRNSILAMHSSFESVAILAISPLSYMTKTEFYQQPDSEEL